MMTSPRYRMRALLAALILTGVAASLQAPIVFAHSLGTSFEATSTPYLIDVGYDPVDFVTGYASRFDFDLRKESGPITGYDYVWVRITKEKQTLFATGVEHQSLGPTTLIYTFDVPGNFVLNVSYRQGSDVLAEAAFPFVVLPDDTDSTVPMSGYVGFGIGSVLGIVGVLLWYRLRGTSVRAIS